MRGPPIPLMKQKAAYAIMLMLAAAMATILLLAQPGHTGAQTTTPDAPSIHTLTAAETWLAVHWNVPSSDGGSAVTNYDVRYIRTDATDKTDSKWTIVEDVRAARTGRRLHVANGLTTGVQYDVQVRAVNANGNGTWSSTSTATPADAPASRTSAVLLPLMNLWAGALQPQYDNSFSGSIASGTDVDYYKIIITRSQAPTLSGFWIYADSDIDTKAELQDRNGDGFQKSDDSGFLPNPKDFLIYNQFPAGTYYLKVSSHGTDTGSYTLKIRNFPETADRTDAADLSIGQIATGQIWPANDVDYYKIVLASQTDLIMRTTAHLDTTGELQNNTGTALESNDDGLLPQDQYQFFIRRTLNAGTYYLKVAGYDGNDFGPYTVRVTAAGNPGSTTATAQAITLGQAGGGNISAAGDTDHFKITLAEDTYVTIWAVHDSAGFDADGEILSSAGQSVTEDYLHDFAGTLGFGIEHHLTAGTHYLKVTGHSGTSTGKYSVLATENRDFAKLVDTCSSITRSTGINDTFYGCQWHLKNTGQFAGGASQDINVEPVWTGGNLGGDVNVAVVDNGLHHQHPDLSPNVLTAKNHNYNADSLIYDPYTHHGTAVAGIIAARDNNFGMRGVAPRAKIYSYNLLDADDETATQQNEADAMSRNSATTAVSNNSWGAPDTATHQPSHTFWRAAIESGITTGYGGKGIFYAFAAGNGGKYGDYSNLDEYANQWGITAVCSVNHSDKRAADSEPGPNLWVCAPSKDGNKAPGIATTTGQGRYLDYFAGTSAATPQVSGLAALLRKANPNLTWRDIKLILAASARKNDATNSGWEEGGLKYGSTTERYQFNHQYGFGVIDAKAAVDMADNWRSLPTLRNSVQASGSLNLAIPDATTVPGSRVSSSITLDDNVEFIEYITLHTQFNHPSFRDLDVELVAPSGKISKMVPNYDKSDGSSIPLDPLNTIFRLGSAKHLGEPAQGAWTLRIRDHDKQAAGQLKSWSITAYGHRTGPDVPTLHALTPHTSGGLILTWAVPTDSGSSDITSYDARHIRTDATDKADEHWTERTGIRASDDLGHHLNILEAQTEYDVQVRAVNKLKSGKWSNTETATTGANTIPAVEGCDLPSLLNRQLVWHGVLTVGESAVSGERVGWGYYGDVGAISGKNTPIVLGVNSYTIGDLLMQFDIDEALAPLIVPPTGALVLNLSDNLTDAEEDDLVLHICDQDFSFADSERPESYHSVTPSQEGDIRDIDYYWTDSGLMWTEGLARIVAFSKPDTGEALVAPPSNDAPAIKSAPTVSSAGDDGQWTEGETVEITLAFTEAVNVDTSGGTPLIELHLGGTVERDAGYRRGDGTTHLVFGYTLVDGDNSHSALLVPANSLALNGGAIRSQATGQDAELQHNGVAEAAIGVREPPEEPPPEDAIPPTARFDGLPESHDGATSFTVELHINPAPEELSYMSVGAAVEVMGGAVTAISRQTAGANGVWLIEVTPSHGDSITVRLPSLACEQPNAICINGAALSETISATVPGLPFVAKFAEVPTEHDGINPFDVHLHFSHEPAHEFSYLTVMEGLFDLTEGTIERVWRLQEGVSRRWGITIAPSGLDDVSITARATTDCAAQHAVCDAAGRMLSGELTSTIIGPSTLSVSDAEVQEATLVFTVTLSRSLSEQITVSYATSASRRELDSQKLHSLGLLKTVE